MALHVRPLGPEPAQTYWRRRALVLAVVLVVVTMLVWAVRALAAGDDTPDRLAEGSGSATETPEVTPPAGPTPADPSATATPAPVDPAAAPLCDPGTLQLVTAADQDSYPVGGRPRLELRVTTSGPAPCSIDLGQAAVSITVMSGSDRIWSSDDCAPGGDSDITTLVPGTPAVSRVTWAGRRSLPGCEGPKAQAQAGTYRVVGKVGVLDATGGSFRITG